MNPVVAQRTLALAGVALLAAVLAVSVSAQHVRTGGDEASTLPEPVSVPGAKAYKALAGVYARRTRGTRTACGHRLNSELEGVSHPVLPCGVKIYIAYGSTEVLTQVIDRGPYVPGRMFDVTPALAEKLDLEGTKQVRWRFARS